MARVGREAGRGKGMGKGTKLEDGSRMGTRVATFVLVCAALATPARAAPLEQPNGTDIPSTMGCNSGDPTGLASVFACECTEPDVCNIGVSCPGDQDPNSCDDGHNGTCETRLWHAWNDDTCIPSNHDGLDPWQDGSLVPETFQPTCPLTFTVLSRGTARFFDAFGWYNAGSGAPATSDLHVMLDCDDPPGTQVVLDVASDPAWQGGEIGFFLLTPENHAAGGECAGGDCCARVDRLPDAGYVYYSQRDLNPDAAATDSYIHLIVYDSRITERKFYFAWEDIYGGDNNDFTDLVTSVSGVECSGGGEPCDTGLDGACGLGLTVCRNGVLTCGQLLQPTEERCNGGDDDCDGEVDEGVECPDDVCGTCCDGIVCPDGETCRDGACIDPCTHVQCNDGEVCREGICFPGCTSCGGIVCAADSQCAADGECVGPATGEDAGPGGGGDGDGDGDGPPAAGCGCRSGGGGAASLALPLLWVFVGRRPRRPRAPQAG